MKDIRELGVSDDWTAIKDPASGKDQSASSGRDIVFRSFDLLFAVVTLPFVTPAILIIMAIIRISDPSHPAIFRQTRYGLRGKPFTILKFRTMVPNAEELKEELASLSKDKGQGFKIPNDPRTTRIGRALRRTYLDELPQLFNVLMGEMSIVGPRANSYPPSTYEPWQLKRLDVKPGLTGDWQISKAKSYDFRERCRIDNEYVDRKSIFRDVMIILKTVKVCLLDRNGE